jgi:hypothetical protein
LGRKIGKAAEGGIREKTKDWTISSDCRDS